MNPALDELQKEPALDILFLLIVCPVVSLIWMAIHIHEYYKTRNKWNLLTIFIFLLASVVPILGLVAAEYHPDRILAPWIGMQWIGFGMGLTFVGAFTRFWLRITNRVGLRKKSPHFPIGSKHI
jgi:hypothetical protein